MARSILLYNWIVNQPPAEIPSMKRMTNQLSNLCLAHAEAINVLIIHYNMLQGNHESVPFNGMLLIRERSVRYDLNNFPEELIQIIANYLKLASKV